MLHVHRCADANALARALAEVLASPPEDPFAAEVVALPAKGVERWLAQRLSHVLGAGTSGDGVCANVRFPSPGTLLDETLAEVSPQVGDAVARWRPEVARWALLDLLDGIATDPAPPDWAATLRRHLRPDDNGEDLGRRASVADRLMRLYDAYAQSRPDLVTSWAAGAHGSSGAGVPTDLSWQPRLWQLLRERIGHQNPVELLSDACAQLRSDPARSTLPARVSVFGASRLSRARLEVLAALGAGRDVHLWLHHASPALWDAAAREQPVRRRAEDTVRRGLRHPLLGSLSRDVLELQQVMIDVAAGQAVPVAHQLHDAPPPPGSLLGHLRADLAADRVPELPPVLDPADRSVQVHACHGRTRQVEVLREVVMGLLAEDKTLQPRDILVMCPDIEAFAPHVAATFALGAEDTGAHPAAQLRVRLADRALRQTNDLLAVLARLLDLGTARVTSSQLLDLAAAPAVRRRFRFDEDDVERLRDWVASSGVRWGLDREHRGRWGLSGVEQGTWHAGLDRVALGAAMEETGGVWGDVLPLDDIDSSELDLAGRFAELVDRVASAQELMSGRRTGSAWTDALGEATLALTATDRTTAWQERQLREELDGVPAGADGHAELTLADIRALLAPVLAGRPTRASFRTGTLTVCTLVPMRSVPHRVICLLGLDDEVFPRRTVRDGDDLLARDPCVGERDPRSEDRQLLLDAICAAGERLVVTYNGMDERTGASIPPAVPLGELLDALDRTAVTEDGRPVRQAITTRHPVQPFDARNFVPGALVPDRPFSFDPLGYDGAASSQQPRTAPAAFLTRALPPPPSDDVALEDLRRLLTHPARGFLRQRLGLARAWADQEPSDALPVELDGLQRWAVGDRLLAARLGGLEPAAALAAETRRGVVPPGRLGGTVLDSVGTEVESVVAAAADALAPASESYDVDVPLGDGTRLTGTVEGIHDLCRVSVTYSKVGPKHRLEAWVDLVALAAARAGTPWTALVIGRGERGGVQTVRLGPLAAATAVDVAQSLVRLYRTGLSAPLPLPLKSAAAYADVAARATRTEVALVQARRAWDGSENFPGEGNDEEHALVYGSQAPFDAVLSAAAALHGGSAGESAGRSAGSSVGGSVRGADHTAFRAIALALWSPLQAAEQRGGA